MRWLLFNILYICLLVKIDSKSASAVNQDIVSINPKSVEIDPINPQDIEFTLEYKSSIIISSGDTQIQIINSDLSSSSYQRNYTLYSKGDNTYSFIIPKNEIVLGSFKFRTLINDTSLLTEDILLSQKEEPLLFNLANEDRPSCKAPFKLNEITGLCDLCKNIDESTPYLEEENCVGNCSEGYYIYKDNECKKECKFLIYEKNCVEQCPNEYGIHPEQDKNYCFNCSISEDYPLALHGECVCDYGLIMDKEKNCHLPLDDIDKPDSEKCLDYCKNGGYCYIENGSPRCNCRETSSYIGIACNIEPDKKEKVVNEYLNNILGNKMDITNTKLMSSVLSLSTILRDTPDAIISLITSEVNAIVQRARFFSYTNTTEDGKKALEMVGLALLAVMRTTQKTSTRRLQEMNLIEDLVRRASEIGSAIAPAMLGTSYYESYKVHADVIDIQFVNINNKNGLAQYKKDTKKKGYVTFDFENTNSTLTSPIIQINIIDKSNTYNNITLLSSVSSYFSLEKISLFYYVYNLNETYDLYKQAGIDIYNPNDKAFTEYCYYNTYFRYDLHQTHRKKNIYQNKTFALKGLEGKCSYYGIENNQTIFNCTDLTLDNSGDSTLLTLIEVKQNITTFEEIKDLSLICVQHINKITDNFAFWFFLIINAFVIILNIVFFSIQCCQEASDNFYLACENDGFPIGDSKEVSGIIQPSNNLINNLPPKDLCSVLQHNFEELHPLPSLAYNSIITPQPITTLFFAFNIFNLFGFNAVYLSEDMFTDRLLDEHRDNFGYPMKREFDKIMSAISTSILLALGMRLLILVPLFYRNYLADEIATAKNQHAKFQEVQHFNMKMLPRRIVALVLMVLLDVFFFYYTIVFCGIYVNTQFGWFYSGIWSLFWVWGVFAPIYIIIISLVEYNGNPNCTYYLKRFFIF